MYIDEAEMRIVIGIATSVVLVAVPYFFSFALWLLDIVAKGFRTLRIDKRTPLNAHNFDMIMSDPDLRTTKHYRIFYPLVIFLKVSFFKKILIKLLSGPRISLPLRKNLPLNKMPSGNHPHISKNDIEVPVFLGKVIGNRKAKREFSRSKKR